MIENIDKCFDVIRLASTYKSVLNDLCKRQQKTKQNKTKRKTKNKTRKRSEVCEQKH